MPRGPRPLWREADATAARADATAARADVAAAQERAAIAAEYALARVSRADRNFRPLARTGSPLPLIALSGLFSLGAAGALRFLRR